MFQINKLINVIRNSDEWCKNLKSRGWLVSLARNVPLMKEIDIFINTTNDCRRKSTWKKNAEKMFIFSCKKSKIKVIVAQGSSKCYEKKTQKYWIEQKRNDFCRISVGHPVQVRMMLFYIIYIINYNNVTFTCNQKTIYICIYELTRYICIYILLD